MGVFGEGNIVDPIDLGRSMYTFINQFFQVYFGISPATELVVAMSENIS